jgi:hypothetical protein
VWWYSFRMSMIFMGFDGEMSGSEINDGHVLVQIGAAFSAEERFTATIGYPVGSYPMNPVAMGVHGISVDEIAAAPSPETVDAQLEEFLLNALTVRGLTNDAKRIAPVGFNVGGFDMPFVRKFLPRTHSMVSRRVVDLNALCFAKEHAARLAGETYPVKWSTWKTRARKYSEEQLRCHGVEVTWHDAGVDALGAMYMFDFLAR